jgi:hypothetical protein
MSKLKNVNAIKFFSQSGSNFWIFNQGQDKTSSSLYLIKCPLGIKLSKFTQFSSKFDALITKHFTTLPTMVLTLNQCKLFTAISVRTELPVFTFYPMSFCYFWNQNIVISETQSTMAFVCNYTVTMYFGQNFNAVLTNYYKKRAWQVLNLTLDKNNIFPKFKTLSITDS